MKITKHPNGTTIQFKILSLNIALRKLNALIEGKSYKCILFQFNRFENGYISVYLRLFFKYSITLTGIKLKEGKRLFLGNKESN